MADIDCGPAASATFDPALAASAGLAAATSAAPNGAPVGHVTFNEFLHAMNPLQHLPVIGTIYRAVTGDSISPAFRIAGSAVGGLLSGGPLGVLGTIAGCFAEELHRMGWNMPDAAAPQSGVASADAGLRPTQTADARTLAPDLPPQDRAAAGAAFAAYQQLDVRGSG